MATSNKVKNVLEKTKGKVKEGFGKLTGNAKVERDGKIDQVMGNVKQTGEKIKDVLGK
jgi:uncharacterized protein YjbJ (UPF0337 family)